MAILEGDVVLLASEIMTDAAEAGGAPTSHKIESGVVGAMFDRISELDRAAGSVNIRKVFPAIRTPSTDTYSGAHIIVSEPPEDPRVSVTLTTTKNQFDRRSDIASAIEAYMVPGSEINGFLLENHVAGQRAIQVFQRPGSEVLPAGQTLCLISAEGTVNEVRQYIRITRVSSETRTFSYSTSGGFSDYQAQVLTCELSDALTVAFAGSPPSRAYARDAAKTAIREMIVADAATYYGVSKTSAAAPMGTRKLKVASVYTQLVPSAEIENALLDQGTAGAPTLLLATSPRRVAVSAASHTLRTKIKAVNRGYNFTFILAPLPASGSVVVSYRALGKWYTLTDLASPGTLSGQGSGTVVYSSGSVLVTCAALPDVNTDVIVSWADTLPYTNRSNSGASARAPEYTFALEHSHAARNSITCTWISGGQTKTAHDNGAGGFTGDATGVVLYSAGLITLRPTTMVDAGGEIQTEYSYNNAAEEIKTGVSVDSAGIATFSTDQEPQPGSIEVGWATCATTTASSGQSITSAGTSKSAGSSQITIPAQYETRQNDTVTQVWDSSPLLGTQNYHLVHNLYSTVEQSAAARSYTVTGSGSNGSTHVVTNTRSATTGAVSMHKISDNGSGGWPGRAGVIGYAAKTLSLQLVAPPSVSSYQQDSEDSATFESANSGDAASGSTGGSSSSKGGSTLNSSLSEAASSTLIVRYTPAGSAANSATQTYPVSALSIDLCPYTQDWVLPGSIQFSLYGHTYRDIDGVLYKDSTDSAVGSIAGSVDYLGGVAQVTDWVVGTGGFVLQSLWTIRSQQWHTSRIYFRTAEAPLKSGGITLSIVDATGAQLVVTSTAQGRFEGPHTSGYIDYQTGVGEILFGDHVLAASLTDAQKGEWWYSGADIQADGTIWRPWSIIPETLRYNGVSYSYLPLDADVLGLNPVRLPADGRVPIYRAGGMAVVGHTGSVGPVTVSTGQTIDCARPRLSRIRVLGNDGNVINAGYTTDLDAGTVTFSDVTGYSQPLTIQHRIEDLVKLSDVQIDGTLATVQPLTHDFPAGSSVSSALVMGDLYARVSKTFDQKTWGNTWSDALIGDTSSASFNSIDYPVAVTNLGAVTERWALVFTSTSTYNVIGEHLGQIATGNINEVCAPNNPAASAPYFSIDPLGWGTGWAAGNVLRLNTVGTPYPVDVIRTVQIGASTVADDSCTMLIRGDIDK